MKTTSAPDLPKGALPVAPILESRLHLGTKCLASKMDGLVSLRIKVSLVALRRGDSAARFDIGVVRNIGHSLPFSQTRRDGTTIDLDPSVNSPVNFISPSRHFEYNIAGRSPDVTHYILNDYVFPVVSEDIIMLYGQTHGAQPANIVGNEVSPGIQIYATIHTVLPKDFTISGLDRNARAVDANLANHVLDEQWETLEHAKRDVDGTNFENETTAALTDLFLRPEIDISTQWQTIQANWSDWKDRKQFEEQYYENPYSFTPRIEPRLPYKALAYSNPKDLPPGLNAGATPKSTPPRPQYSPERFFPEDYDWPVDDDDPLHPEIQFLTSTMTTAIPHHIESHQTTTENLGS